MLSLLDDKDPPHPLDIHIHKSRGISGGGRLARDKEAQYFLLLLLGKMSCKNSPLSNAGSVLMSVMVSRSSWQIE